MTSETSTHLVKPDEIQDDDIVDVDDFETLEASTPHDYALVPYQEPGLPMVVSSSPDLQYYLRQAEAAPMLSAQEEYQLATRLRDHDDLEAAQKLIISHLRLVIKIARGYLGYGLPFDDLIQEGNIGLMKAIRHFDPERKIRLTTFAQHWVRSEIQEYVIRNWRLVKLATTKNQRKLFFNLRKLKPESHKALTYNEAKAIASTLNVKPQEVLDMEERMYGQELSFDHPHASDEEDTFAPSDWLSNEDDNPSHQLEVQTQQSWEHERLQKALESLDERARRVIQARYLTMDSNGQVIPETLQNLAQELGVSAERVRQIEKAALKKMRSLMSE